MKRPSHVYNPTKVARLAEINALWDATIGWSPSVIRTYVERKFLIIDISRMKRRNKHDDNVPSSA